jgi:hypothetical protein
MKKERIEARKTPTNTQHRKALPFMCRTRCRENFPQSGWDSVHRMPVQTTVANAGIAA